MSELLYPGTRPGRKDHRIRLCDMHVRCELYTIDFVSMLYALLTCVVKNILSDILSESWCFGLLPLFPCTLGTGPVLR